MRNERELKVEAARVDQIAGVSPFKKKKKADAEGDDSVHNSTWPSLISSCKNGICGVNAKTWSWAEEPTS